jgi:putative addiction module component (TIGR02574 family)
MSIAELLALPRMEKLKIVEALWEDLSAEPESVHSPDWHGHELEKTSKAYEAGEIEALDWDEAKQALLQRGK